MNVDYNFTRFVFNTATITFFTAFYNQTYSASLNSVLDTYTSTYRSIVSAPQIGDSIITANVAGFANITFNGKSKIVTSNTTTTITPILILNCSNTISNTTTLNVTIYNEENLSIVNNSFLKSVFDISYGVSLIRRNISFDQKGNASYLFCFYPDTSNITADITFYY